MSQMELRIKPIDYLSLRKLIKVYFPKKGLRAEVADALIWIMCLCSCQRKDDELMPIFHVRSHDFKGGPRILVVGKKRHDVKNTAFTRAVDLLVESNLASVEKGYFVDEKMRKNGSTILFSRKIRKLLEKYDKMPSVNRVPGRYAFVLKHDDVLYENYKNFREKNGHNFRVFNAFRRGKTIEQIYNSAAVGICSVWDAPESKATSAVLGFMEKYPEVPENEVLSAVDYLGAVEFDKLFRGGLITAHIHGFDYGRITCEFTQIRKFLSPLVQLDGEFLYSCDLVGAVPQLIMNQWGESVPDDVYQEILDQIGKQYSIDRAALKKGLLFSLNMRKGKKAVGYKIYGDSFDYVDYMNNFRDLHSCVAKGEFEKAVHNVSPALRASLYNPTVQEKIITIEQNLFQNVQVSIWKKTGKSSILKFDELLIPESVPHDLVLEIIQDVAERIVFRGFTPQIKAKIKVW